LSCVVIDIYFYQISMYVLVVYEAPDECFTNKLLKR
jgi:hypothetical protein